MDIFTQALRRRVTGADSDLPTTTVSGLAWSKQYIYQLFYLLFFSFSFASTCRLNNIVGKSEDDEKIVGICLLGKWGDSKIIRFCIRSVLTCEIFDGGPQAGKIYIGRLKRGCVCPRNEDDGMFSILDEPNLEKPRIPS